MYGLNFGFLQSISTAFTLVKRQLNNGAIIVHTHLVLKITIHKEDAPM